MMSKHISASGGFFKNLHIWHFKRQQKQIHRLLHLYPTFSWKVLRKKLQVMRTRWSLKTDPEFFFWKFNLPFFFVSQEYLKKKKGLYEPEEFPIHFEITIPILLYQTFQVCWLNELHNILKNQPEKRKTNLIFFINFEPKLILLK